METRSPPTTLTGDACRRLEAIIRDDLEHATVSSAMVLVEEGGRITINELVLRLEDGRMVTLMPLDIPHFSQLIVNRQPPLHDLRPNTPQPQFLKLPWRQPQALGGLVGRELLGWGIGFGVGHAAMKALFAGEAKRMGTLQA